MTVGHTVVGSKRIRLVLALLATAFLGGTLHAATLHVATSGGCLNHPAIGSACSSSSSCGSAGSPCCSLEIADGPAGSGDTVEMHHGVYSGSVSAGGRSFSAGIDTPNLTVRAGSGDTPVLNGAHSVQGCIYTSQDNLTVDGITCDNHICGSESSRTGIIYTTGSSGSRFRNMTINVALPPSQGEFACGGFRLVGSGSGNTIIENNLITGNMGHTFFVEDHSGSDGVVIRNNVVLLNRASHSWDAYRVMAVKGSTVNTPVAFYNNRVTRTAQLDAAGAMLFMREIRPEAHVYVFNNICVDCGTQYSIYTQDNSCPSSGTFWDQNVDVFNNTETGDGLAVDWQNYWTAMRVQNNLFDGSSVGVDGSYSASENCGHTDASWSSATDKFTNNIIEHSNGSIFGGIANSSVVDASGTTISASAETQRDSSNHLLASTRAGTNDPLGQGPGVCSITMAGQTINCALDINGESRGLAWDIGADQFQGGSSGPLPVVQNLVRADARP